MAKEELIDMQGTGTVAYDALEAAVRKVFRLTPSGIIQMLDMARPIYRQTATYGHFGRTPDAEGGFSWEKTDLAEALNRAI